VLRVDDADVVFGSAAGTTRVRSAVFARPRVGSRSVWVRDNVSVTQVVELTTNTNKRGEACLIGYLLENTGDKPRSVGLRSLIDTFIIDQDGHPFAVPGKKELITTQADFRGQDVPDVVQALQHGDLVKPGVIAPFSLKIGGFGLGGIGTATFGAIILYAILRKEKEPGPVV